MSERLANSPEHLLRASGNHRAREVRIDVPISHADNVGAFLPEELKIFSPEISKTLEAKLSTMQVANPVFTSKRMPNAPVPQAITDGPNGAGDRHGRRLNGRDRRSGGLSAGQIISIVVTVVSLVFIIVSIL